MLRSPSPTEQQWHRAQDYGLDTVAIERPTDLAKFRRFGVDWRGVSGNRDAPASRVDGLFARARAGVGTHRMLRV